MEVKIDGSCEMVEGPKIMIDDGDDIARDAVNRSPIPVDKYHLTIMNKANDIIKHLDPSIP